MEKKIQVIKQEDYKTSQWSGGTTIELLIYPKEAEYNKRNFKWRLSSAKVELEESTFTHLPGISRILMIIEGDLRLQHEGKQEIILKPFEQNSFMGDWNTKSFGKVTDFNLMMAEGCTGTMTTLSIAEGEKISLLLQSQEEILGHTIEAFYVVSGELVVTTEEQIIPISQGEMCTIALQEAEQKYICFTNKGREDIMLIRSTIYY